MCRHAEVQRRIMCETAGMRCFTAGMQRQVGNTAGWQHGRLAGVQRQVASSCICTHPVSVASSTQDTQPHVACSCIRAYTWRVAAYAHTVSVASNHNVQHNHSTLQHALQHTLQQPQRAAHKTHSSTHCSTKCSKQWSRQSSKQWSRQWSKQWSRQSSKE